MRLALLPALLLAATGSPSPAILTIPPSSLPGHFSRSAHPVSNAEVASVSGLGMDRIRASGRVMGVEVTYSRQVLHGIWQVVDNVTEYQGRGDAVRAYHFWLTRHRAEWSGYPEYHEELEGRGQIALHTIECICPSFRQRVDIAESHKGAYIMLIEVHYLPGAGTDASMAAETLRLLHLQKRLVPR
jgi:hypothetical protein